MPVTPPQDSAAFREEMRGRVTLPIVVTGTTSATINTAATLAHGLTDGNGSPVPAANIRAVAYPTSNAGQLYQPNAPTATVLDIRSTVASVPYVALVWLV